MIKTKRLPLKGLCNARDLGGFPCEGGLTCYGAFIRSEVPHRITDEDMAFLLAYGLTTSLDLRGKLESEEPPSRLRELEGHRYFLCPMVDDTAAAGSGPRPGSELELKEIDWRPVYIGMSERGKAWVKRTLELAAEAEGCVLYHCFTGKDRTGLFTALLLGLCGVEKRDIMGDYSLSMSNLRPFYEAMPHPEGMAPTKEDMLTGFYRTDPITMEALLDHFEQNYGGVKGYVRACGVSEATIQRIRDKLIEKDEA